MGFTGAHMLYVLDVFILALYLLSHVCALLEYTFQKIKLTPLTAQVAQTCCSSHWTLDLKGNTFSISQLDAQSNSVKTEHTIK